MSDTALDKLLTGPAPVLLDGAVGSELLRRGIKTRLPLWSAHALLTEEGLSTLFQIHLDYARAGAQILTTNTFRTGRRVLRLVGKDSPEEWREINRLAVKAARDASAAVAPQVCLVAGGIAPLEDCYQPDLAPPEEVCYLEHQEHARLLQELGVDLLLLETMSSGREARAALRAARETGLDILLSLCPMSPAHLLSGEPLQAVIPDLIEIGGEKLRGLMLNCATPEVMDSAYPELERSCPNLPHGLYPHMGEPDDEVGWKSSQEGRPTPYASWMASRVTKRTGFVGGCCGTTPEHILALRHAVRG